MGIRGRVLWVSKGNHSHRPECPISAATSDSLRSSSVRAIALRLGNSLPYTDTSRLVPRPFFTLDSGSELPGLSASANRGRGGDRAFAVNRTGDSPFCDCDCP